MSGPMDPRDAIRLLRDPAASFGNDVSMRIAACIEHQSRELAQLRQLQLQFGSHQDDRYRRLVDLMDECDAMGAHPNRAAREFAARVANFLVLDAAIEVRST